jgi:hypothetical protein
MKLAEARALAVGTVIYEVYCIGGTLYPESAREGKAFAGVQGRDIAYKLPSGVRRLVNPLRWFPEDHPDYVQAQLNAVNRRLQAEANAAAEKAHREALSDIRTRFGAMVLELDGDHVRVRIPVSQLADVAAVLAGGAP